MKGDGVQYDYGFRIYDSRIARFLSVDPLTKSYPMLTPYQFASNRPIRAVDIDGLESSWWPPGMIGQEMAKETFKGNSYSYWQHNATQEELQGLAAEIAFVDIPLAYLNGLLFVESFGSRPKIPLKFRPKIKINKSSTSTGFWQTIKSWFSSSKSSKQIDLDDVPLKTSSNSKRSNKINRIADYLRVKLRKPNSEINKFLESAIEYTKGVKVYKLEKGTKVYRYERIGKESTEKHFFTSSDLGTEGAGFGSATGYRRAVYELTEDVEVLDTAIKGSGGLRQLIFDGTKIIKEIK